MIRTHNRGTVLACRLRRLKPINFNTRTTQGRSDAIGPLWDRRVSLRRRKPSHPTEEARMADRTVWIDTDGDEPTIEWMRALARLGVYYNGRGRFRAMTAAAADAGISWFRARGVEASRGERVRPDRMTQAHAVAIGRSISAPRRWTI